MKNKIYINGVLVTDYQQCVINKRIRYKLVLQSGDSILLHKNKKIQCEIYCTQCDKHTKLTFNKRFIETSFLCKSCRFKGDKNPFCGKTHSEKAKRAISLKNTGRFKGKKSPVYGKSLYDFLSEDDIKKWKARLSLANSGSNNPFYGKKHTDQVRQHLSKVRAGKNIGKQNPMYGKKLYECMSHEKYIEWLKHFSNTLNKHTTIPEKIVEQWLKDNSIKYKHSFFLFNKKTKHSHQYDFYIDNTNFLIEVQGDYWHGNPMFYSKCGDDSHKKLDQLQLSKIKTDIIKNKLASEYGFKVIYIWENEIKNGNFKSLMPIYNQKYNIPQ